MTCDSVTSSDNNKYILYALVPLINDFLLLFMYLLILTIYMDKTCYCVFLVIFADVCTLS